MKKFLLAAVISCVVAAAFAQIAGFGNFSLVNASTTVPAQFTNTTLLVNGFTCYGRKAKAANIGTVWIGQGSTDETQLIEVPTGGEVSVNAPPGKFINLKDWYCDVTTVNDGLTIVYY